MEEEPTAPQKPLPHASASTDTSRRLSTSDLRSPTSDFVHSVPEFQGIEAAWKRAAAKAIAEAKAAGLEPVVAKPQKQDAS